MRQRGVSAIGFVAAVDQCWNTRYSKRTPFVCYAVTLPALAVITLCWYLVNAGGAAFAGFLVKR